MGSRRLALLVLCLGGPLLAQGESAYELAGRVDHAPVGEMSGIVRSRTYPGVWWVHNDSGDEPRIYAVDAAGRIVLPDFERKRYHAEEAEEGKAPWPGVRLLVAANVDWEDLAIDGDVLYVADVGNNGNARRDLGVYVVPEPNPRATGEQRPLRFLPIRYPDQDRYPAEQWHFDCEAVFVASGKLHFLTKHRVAGQIHLGARGTKLYRLDTAETERPNVLTLLDSRDDLSLPTAADLSPDGKRLAVLTTFAIWVFEKPAEGDRWLTSGRARRLALDLPRMRMAEAVCWDDDETIRIGCETRELYRVPRNAIPEAAEAEEGR